MKSLTKGLFAFAALVLAGACTPREEVLLTAVDQDVFIQKMTLNADEFFRFDSAELTPEVTSELDEVAATLRAELDPSVLVIGHTDRLGSDEYNRSLSERRAKAVGDYIARLSGIGNDRVRVVGAGESRPVVTCPDNLGSEAVKACLAPNRRVEVVFTADALVERSTVTVVTGPRDGSADLLDVEQYTSEEVRVLQN